MNIKALRKQLSFVLLDKQRCQNIQQTNTLHIDMKTTDLVYLKQNKSENLNLLLRHIHEKNANLSIFFRFIF